jgi:hypothetical protein
MQAIPPERDGQFRGVVAKWQVDDRLKTLGSLFWMQFV